MDRNVVIMFMECIYMKKIILLILSFFVITNVKAIELPKKTDHETVVIYLFRGKDCSHCHDALTWFSDNLTRYEEYIEVRSYEVYQNPDNSILASNVADKMGKVLDGIPYIIVGDSYDQVGFKVTDGEKIIKAALKEYENEKYNDLVLETLAGMSGVHYDTLEEALELEGLKKGQGNAVVATIVAGLMLLIGGFIFFAKE